MHRLAFIALALVLAGCLQVHDGSPAHTAASSSSSTAPLPPLPVAPEPAPVVEVVPLAAPTSIGHVFVIVLENEDFASTFPASDPPSPELAINLTAQGRFLPQYYGIGHASLDNYIAMVSGQAPNPVTQADCAYYAEFLGSAGGPDGQAIGHGCVYPAAVLTIGDQLTAANHTWRAYAEDMAN